MSTARGENAPTSESMRKRVLEAQSTGLGRPNQVAQIAHAAMNTDERCSALTSKSGWDVRCYLTTTHEGKHHGWHAPSGGEIEW